MVLNKPVIIFDIKGGFTEKVKNNFKALENVYMVKTPDEAIETIEKIISSSKVKE